VHSFSSILPNKIALTKIEDEITLSAGVELCLLRLDQIHEGISGNKWFKLKYNLEKAQIENKTTLLSFGGAYSNHLHAVASAGKLLNYKTIGIIRGEEPLSNPTIFSLKEMGMNLIQVSRSDYQQKNTLEFYEKNISPLGDDIYVIPEGGTNEFAIKGTSEIWNLLSFEPDYLTLPVGTGGTLAGLASANNNCTSLLGFVALKGAQYLENEIAQLSNHQQAPTYFHNYHFGGFGKYSPELLLFIEEFEKNHKIPVEQVYTGKMMFGIYDLIKHGYFKPHSKIIAIHTGGLQGKLSQ